LIAELRLAFGKWTVAIEARAGAVGAGKLAVDERGHAALATRRRQLVSGDHGVGGGTKERVLGLGEGEPDLRLRGGRRCWRRCDLRLRVCRRLRRDARRHGGAGAEEEIAARDRQRVVLRRLVGHVILPFLVGGKLSGFARTRKGRTIVSDKRPRWRGNR